ncbi:MAG: hypothetical protein ISS79_13320 [Phycisphaerae bacterium]|nr:hypothetical protein [Phycisphaerae bacterium]
MPIFEIKVRDIKNLRAEELTMLLKRLLLLEAECHGIARSAVNVALEINVPDGGRDGFIKWDDGPEPEDFVPSRFTLFQCKATPMGFVKCKGEVLTKSGEVKPKVKDVLDAKGAYVLFVGEKSKNCKGR